MGNRLQNIMIVYICEKHRDFYLEKNENSKYNGLLKEATNRSIK